MSIRRLVGSVVRAAVVAWLAAATSASAVVCDVNNDGSIDRTDIGLITGSLGSVVPSGDARDANGDLRITIVDSRACTLRCTRAGCALPPANQSPVANADAYTTAEDTPLIVPASGVLGNDSDPDGNPLTASVVSGPASGALLLNADGSFAFTPAPDFAGELTFTYRASDGIAASNLATVTLTVTPVNDAPVALADSYAVNENQTLVIAAPGVLANDTDADGNPPTGAALVSGPASGTLALDPDGSFTYVPASDVSGMVTFTYRASDGVDVSNVATVTIDVRPVDGRPVANPDAYSINEDTPLSVMAPGVLGNDSDPESAALSAMLLTAPASGVLQLNADGSFTYTPAANATGAMTFTYRASDGGQLSDAATATINVLPANDAPVAANDAYTTARDTPLTVVAPGVLGNDIDIDGDALTASLVSAPAIGTLSFNGSGSFTYTPAAGATGPVTFTYRASDGSIDSNVATVSIEVVAGGNTAPVAVNDSYATAEDAPLTVPAAGVLGNDTDANGDPLTASLVTGPLSGTLLLDSSGSFTYTPNANFNGSDSFTYRAGDGLLDSLPATVSITVTPVNDVPAANDDAYTTPEDTTLTVPAQGVLANDSDADGDALTTTLQTSPASGTLALNTDGSFSYTPAANANGTVTFTYRASDGTASSGIATVAIVVTPVNDAPLAQDDSYSTTANVALTVPASGVLGNDTDPDGQVLVASLQTAPANGTLVLNGNGGFVYTPNAGFTGPDGFTYRASDGIATSNVATVTIAVTAAPNAPPVAVNDTYAATEDTPLTIAAPGVLGNDTDANGNALTAAVVSAPAQGTLALAANGGFTYTPPANFNGPATFTYRANDGLADSNTATVTIDVAAVNDAPVVAPDTYATPEDTPLAVPAPGVLGNDTDVEGSPLSAALEAGPAKGTLVLNSNGSFTYAPNANANGADSFTYRASDGAASSPPVTVTVNVTPVNDAPEALANMYSTPEDTPLAVAAPGVLGNDTDADGSALTAIIVGGESQGTLVLNANGGFSYSPPPDFNGPATFTYKANDGAADSSTVAVTINVTPVNDLPVANVDSHSTLEDTTLVVAAPGVLGNDTDAEGNPLTAALVSGSANGAVTLNPNGGFSFTPAANFVGVTTFSYRASDGTDSSNVATVTINVTPVNDVPVANADAYSTNEDTPLNVAAPGVLTNDLDVEGGPMTAILETSPATGNLTLNPNGSFTYVPAPNASGSPVTFTYRAADGTAPSTPATVTITVLPINDAPVAANDPYNTSINTTLDVVAPGVLANDTDQEGSGLTAVLVAGPANGVLALNANGSFSYTPNAGFAGTDSFTYRASDGTLTSNVGTVSIAVSGGMITLTLDSSLVGVGRTVNGTVSLSQPAPAGGVTVALASSDTDVVTVAPPSVAIAQGQTTGSFSITGIALGNADIVGTATGYADGNAGVSVTANVVSIGDVTVAPGQQAGFPVTISAAAPAGGLIVNLTSSDPTIVSVPAFVVIPAGQTIASPNPLATAGNIGSATITGTAASFAPGSGTGTVAISASFAPNPVTVVAGGTAQTTLTLVQPAPAGGITVNLTIANPARATVATPVAIPAGQSTAVATVTGVSAGGATTLQASGVGLTTTTATVNVTNAPAITLSSVTIGKDLQQAVSFSLGAPAPAGNLQLTFTSATPSSLLVAPNATTAGSASITITVPAGQSNGQVVVQSLAGSGSAVVNVSAPNYADGSATYTLVPSGFAIANPGNFSTTTLDPNTTVRVCAYQLNPSTLAAVAISTLRMGIGTVSLSMTNSNTGVGTLVNTPQTLTGNQNCTPNTSSGFQFDPASGGTSTVAMGPTPAGFSTPINMQSIVATVTASGINAGTSTVGRNLQAQVGGSLDAPAPAGGLMITLTSGDPARLLLAPNASTAGAASIVVTAPQNSTGFTYYAHALDSTGTVQVNASASTFGNGTGTITLVPSGFSIESPNSIPTTTLDPNSTVRVCAYRLNPATLATAAIQSLRAGIGAVSLSLTSSNTLAGTIVNTPQVLNGNQNCTPLNATGFQFDPAGAGTSTIAMGPTPAGFSTPSNFQSIVATVTASGFDLNPVTVGRNLQSPANGSLQAPAPTGGISVTLSSADPARLLLAPNAGTAGTPSINVTVNQGQTGFNYVVQALDGTGTVQVNASAPGFANGAGTITLVPSGFLIETPNSIATTTLDPNTNVRVCSYRLNPTNLSSVQIQSVRTGISPVTVSLTSSNIAVGTIVNTPQTFSGNQNCTLLNATGFQFDPVGVGSSTVAMGPAPAGFSTPSNFQSIAATVTASGIDLAANTVGRNLQVTASGSLQAPAPTGGATVTLTSADPARLLLANNLTTAGTQSINVTVAQGQANFTYVLQGLDGAGTVQVTAAATGFQNGAGTITLAPSGFGFSTGNFTVAAGATNRNVQVCVYRLNPATLNVVTTGTLRSGIGPVSLAVASSNTAVGTIVNSPQALNGNQNCTPNSAAGFQFDPATVGTSVLSLGATPAGFSTPSNDQAITATVN